MTSPGALVVDDWQIEFRGYLIGGNEPFAQMEVDGLLDLPEVRSTDRARLRRDGTRPAQDFAGARVVTFTMELHGDTAADFTEQIRLFQEAFALSRTELPLVLRIPGISVDPADPRVILYGRCRQRNFPMNLEYYYRTPILQLQFHCSDPRLYAFNRRSGSVAVRTPAGGVVPPLTPPVVFGAPGTGGTIQLDNPGAYETPVVWRIDGPVTQPRVYHAGLDQYLWFDLTLDSGQWLIVDSDSQRALLNGQSPRRVLFAGSDWFHLEPGANQIQFTSAGAASTGTLTATYRAASI